MLTDAHDSGSAPARPGAPGAVSPEASDSFVLTPFVERVATRALAYLEVGYAVHLSGPAGTGKTTLAFHLAAQLGRPVTLIHGNDEFASSDLIGRDSGYRKSTLVDNYIHSVLRTEENVSVKWTSNRLTTACEEGHTLIYDEFNRTRPEANNILLSVLEEGILNLPRSGGGYVRVSPDFRVIFTSNPAEYAGVHRTQDALLDRMITIRVDHYDATTETEILRAKTGLDPDSSEFLVRLAGRLRSMGDGNRPTIRACVAAARMLSHAEASASPHDPYFRAVAWDIFGQDAGQDIDEEGFARLLTSMQTLEAPGGRGAADEGREDAPPHRPRRYERRAA